MFSFGDEVEETYNNPSGSIKRFLGLKGGCAGEPDFQSRCGNGVFQSISCSVALMGKLASRSPP